MALMGCPRLPLLEVKHKKTATLRSKHLVDSTLTSLLRDLEFCAKAAPFEVFLRNGGEGFDPLQVR